MSEAPKRIWIGSETVSWNREESRNHDQEYIRADIVEKMREALEWISKNTTEDWEYQAVAVSALKRLEEE